MRHYFANHGRPLTINLEGMVADVRAAKEAMIAEFRQARAFVQKLPPGMHYFTSKSDESSYNTQAQNAD